MPRGQSSIDWRGTFLSLSLLRTFTASEVSMSICMLLVGMFCAKHYIKSGDILLAGATRAAHYVLLEAMQQINISRINKKW